jgi:hypothetical protein
MGMNGKFKSLIENSEKSKKKNDEQILSASLKHGEPYLGFKANPFDKTSGKYIVFRDKSENHNVKFTIADHSNPHEQLALMKVRIVPGDGMSINHVWMKPIHEGRLMDGDNLIEKYVAFNDISDAFTDALGAHTAQEHGYSASRNEVKDGITRLIIEVDAENRQRDFIGKEIAREKKKLDESLAGKRISQAEYAAGLNKAVESASLKFQKVLEDESKMLGRLAKKRREAQK